MLTGAARKAWERPRRSRRHDTRPQVLRGPKTTRRHLQIVTDPGPIDPDRPKLRSDCLDAPRPCPYVSCRHHLYADVNARTGTIKVNRPDLEPEDLEHSCSLDLADRGPVTMEFIGAIMNLTRERVRQIEESATRKLAPLFEGWNPEDDE